MPFCKNCGAELIAGAKFCQKCGSSIIDNPKAQQEHRQEYGGKVYKCPRCGEVLNSFSANCPACGFELRGTAATNSVRELARKLEAIEARRDRIFLPKKNNVITSTDQQKISLIKNFPIPNTKEDLYEFLVLASSNIDFDAYRAESSTDVRTMLSNAWRSKLEQAYQKASLIYQDDPQLAEIQELYKSVNSKIKKAKRREWKEGAALLMGYILFFPILFICLSTVVSIGEKNETKRLENIVTEIEEQLEAGEFKYALMIADTLVYDRSNAGEIRKWETRRTYWIEKIIEEASEHGIELEYTPLESDVSGDDHTSDTPTISEDNRSENTDATGGGFVNGFSSAIQSGIENFENATSQK